MLSGAEFVLLYCSSYIEASQTIPNAFITGPPLLRYKISGKEFRGPPPLPASIRYFLKKLVLRSTIPNKIVVPSVMERRYMRQG